MNCCNAWRCVSICENQVPTFESNDLTCKNDWRAGQSEVMEMANMEKMEKMLAKNYNVIIGMARAHRLTHFLHQ